LPQHLRNWLLAYKRKTVSLDVLQEVCMPMAYAEFRALLLALMEQKILVPIKASGADHGGLARKYTLHRGPLLAPVARKIEQEATADGISGEIDLSWYRQHPYSDWQRARSAIRQLSLYLQEHPSAQPLTSLQQRSYDIFGDEKLLLQSAGLLQHLGIQQERLGIAPEADPLMFATRPLDGQASVYHHLVVENKAPWMALLPHLAATPFTTLILGYGWKICSGLGQLPLQCGLPEAKHIVWYFGDLDWEGIRIFTTLQDRSTLEVRLAAPFYSAFWQHSASKGKESQQSAPEILPLFLHQLPEEIAKLIPSLLEAGSYYPQEALTPAELLTCAKETIHGTGKF